MQIQIFNVHIANRIALVDNSTFVLYIQEEVARSGLSVICGGCWKSTPIRPTSFRVLSNLENGNHLVKPLQDTHCKYHQNS